MEGGELAAESMDTLTELGDELTLGDIDGRRRGKERGMGWRQCAWAPHACWGSARVSPRGPAAAGVGGVGGWSLDRASGVVRVGALPARRWIPRPGWVQAGARSAFRRAALAWRAASRVCPARAALPSGFGGAAARLESRLWPQEGGGDVGE